MTDTQTDLLEKIVAEIAPRLTVKGDKEPWSIKEVAKYFKYDSTSYVLQNFVCLPDFPRSRRKRTAKGKTQPLWEAQEIIEWWNSWERE